MSVLRFMIGFFVLGISFSAVGQYAPAAGKPGSTAVFMDSTAIIAWADSCVIQRGWKDIAVKDSGFVTYGSIENCVGKANGKVLSLGDSGVVTLSFNVPITNGPGPDFVIFENGITDGFLELGFVEVSSDGKNFVRFPAISETDTAVQTGPFGSTDPTKLYNFAGKYRAQYGTPFDLEELKDVNSLDISSITHVRIVDVIGSMNDLYASRDSRGVKVNDPYPTAFPSSGFDLDAVGVMFNKDSPTSIKEDVLAGVRVFPTLTQPNENIYIFSNNSSFVTVCNSYGQVINKQKIEDGKALLNIGVSGVYYVSITHKGGAFKTEKVIVK